MPVAPFLTPSAAVGAARSLARPAVRLMREMPVHSDRLRQRGRGPLAVFLPARGPEGASLLRCYAVAGALRAHGWRTLVLPWKLTLAQRHRMLALSVPDVLVMQSARHVLNQPALYPGQPVVCDMDDADFHLPHLVEPVRRATGQAQAVIAGSAYIADWARAAGAPAVHVVWTGSPVSRAPRPPQAARGPVVAWAQSRPMTYLREAETVRRAMAALAARRPGTVLRLYDRRPGDDPGFAESFRAPGLAVEWRESCRYRAYLGSFDDVSLGLAPLAPEAPFSRGKSFGKILAYLDRGVPVIASRTGEPAGFFTPRTGVLADRAEEWAAAADRLLGDAGARERMAAAAHGAFRRRLSVDAAARRTDRILRGLINIS